MKWSVKKRGRFWLVKSRKKSFWLTPYFFKKLSFYFKQGADVSEIDQLIFSLLKERVLYFLSLRDRSEFEIERYFFKLKQERFLPKIKRWLKRLGFLDDRRFGMRFVEYQKERLVGPFYIARELRKRGLSQKLVEEILAKSYTKKEERKKANILFKKYNCQQRLKNAKEKAKLVRFFSGRGFSQEVIYELIE